MFFGVDSNNGNTRMLRYYKKITTVSVGHVFMCFFYPFFENGKRIQSKTDWIRFFSKYPKINGQNTISK